MRIPGVQFAAGILAMVGLALVVVGLAFPWLVIPRSIGPVVLSGADLWRDWGSAYPPAILAFGVLGTVLLASRRTIAGAVAFCSGMTVAGLCIALFEFAVSLSDRLSVCPGCTPTSESVTSGTGFVLGLLGASLLTAGPLVRLWELRTRPKSTNP